MTDSDVRALLNAEWIRIDQEAEARKDSHSAVFELARLYRSLSREERFVADQVLIEWALSGDEKKQFDALAMIDEFSISSAIPALNRLAARFKQAKGPSAPYDLAKVNRILDRLAAVEVPGD